MEDQIMSYLTVRGQAASILMNFDLNVVKSVA